MGRVLPILFNTDMVRAILDGRKTVTRRCVKPQPPATAMVREIKINSYGWSFWEAVGSWHMIRLPYQPGDILYVRETWCRVGTDVDKMYFEHSGAMWDGMYLYRADGHDLSDIGNWHPSIHMPKIAARIWLKVTDVRVERLQDITEEQAAAEGVPDELSYPIAPIYCPTCKGEGQVGSLDSSTLGYVPMDCPDCKTEIIRFANLWNSTIKKADHASYGWNANPWVWVIEFVRCEKPDN